MKDISCSLLKPVSGFLFHFFVCKLQLSLSMPKGTHRICTKIVSDDEPDLKKKNKERNPTKPAVKMV